MFLNFLIIGAFCSDCSTCITIAHEIYQKILKGFTRSEIIAAEKIYCLSMLPVGECNYLTQLYAYVYQYTNPPITMSPTRVCSFVNQCHFSQILQTKQSPSRARIPKLANRYAGRKIRA